MNEWVWSNGGMILTGENLSTGIKTLYSVGGKWMNEYGGMVEWYWQGKTEVLGEKHYTAWTVDEGMCVKQWWNYTDRTKEKNLEKTESECHIIQHQPYKGLTWDETRAFAKHWWKYVGIPKKVCRVCRRHSSRVSRQKKKYLNPLH